MLETLLSMLLTTMVMAVCTRVWLSLEQGQFLVLKSDEIGAMWMSLERTMSQNVHSATSAAVAFGRLSLRLDDGTTYQYGVNNEEEFVRTTSGGGSAVICARMKTISYTLTSKAIVMTATFDDGETDSMTLGMLTAM